MFKLFRVHGFTCWRVEERFIDILFKNTQTRNTQTRNTQTVLLLTFLLYFTYEKTNNTLFRIRSDSFQDEIIVAGGNDFGYNDGSGTITVHHC